VINRLEAAAYDGHSLRTLRKLAAALNSKIEVRFVPRKRAGQKATKQVGEQMTASGRVAGPELW
jgi:hypothetical protein